MSLQPITIARGGDLYANNSRALIPAPGHSARDRSVSLMIGRNGRVIVHSFGGATVSEVLDDLRSSGLIDSCGYLTGPSIPAAPPPVQPSQRARIARAADLWNEGTRLENTPAERYLNNARAIERSTTGILNLRFHPACPLRAYEPNGRTKPALLARIQTGEEELCGIEILYLTSDGRRDERLRTSRKIIGAIPAGAYVALDAPADHMLVAEGVMTALSAGTRFKRPARALLSANNLRRFSVETSIRSLIIAADRGSVGEAAAAALCQRVLMKLQAVEVVLPPLPYDDFNSWDQAQAKRRREGRGG